MTKLLGLGDSIKYKGKEYDVKGFTKTDRRLLCPFRKERSKPISFVR